MTLMMHRPADIPAWPTTRPAPADYEQSAAVVAVRSVGQIHLICARHQPQGRRHLASQIGGYFALADDWSDSLSEAQVTARRP
jgi:hypothetical protein